MATKKSDSTKSTGGGAAKKTAAKTPGKGASSAAGGKEKSLTEMVAALAERAGITKAQAKEVLDHHADLLIAKIKTNGSVRFAGIGKLKMGERAERQGRNPATGETITIKASKTVKFAGGKHFKENFQ